MSPCAEVGLVFSESESEDLCAQQGAPGVLAVQLALVTVVQYMEDLSDWEAAEAVHSRIDLKYLLGVELANEGFDYLVLREFRQRLVAGEAQRRLLDKLLSLCQGKGWLKAGGKQRTDSTHIVGAVRSLSRQAVVGETLRYALNRVAEAAPAWLQAPAFQFLYRHQAGC